MADIVDRLVAAGTKMGYSGTQLQNYVTTQQKLIKEEQDKIRDERQKERDHERQKMEEEKAARELEEKKLAEAEADRELKLKIESEKLALEQKRLDLEKLKMDQKKEETETAVRGKMKLPIFDDSKDKFDSYISRFETFAKFKKWKKEDWSLQLSLLLTGGALEIFYGLSEEDQKSYDALKEALLRKYQLTEDQFRKNFFFAKAEMDETPAQFMARIERIFSKWLELSHVEKTYEAICSLFVREQFIRRCRADLQAYIKEKKITDNIELANIAQRYLDAHGGNMSEEKPRSRRTQDIRKKDKAPSDKAGQAGLQRCTWCNKTTHKSDNCWSKYGKPDKPFIKMDAQTHPTIVNTSQQSFNKQNNTTAAMTVSKDTKCVCLENHSSCALINEVIGDFQEKAEIPTTVNTSDGNADIHSEECSKPINLCSCVPLDLSVGKVNGKSVQVMRDTGCTSIVVKSSLVNEDQYTGSYRVCKLIDGTVRRFPLVFIQVESDHVNGDVEAIAMNKPVYDLIIGNVYKYKQESDSVQLTVQIQPMNKQNHPLQISMNSNDKSIEQLDKEPDSQTTTEDTSNLNYSKNDDTTNLAAVVTRSQAQLEKKGLTPLSVPSLDIVDKDELINQQKNDKTLEKYYKLAQDKKQKENKNGVVSFEVKNGLLHRIYTPKNGGKLINQILTPKEQRSKVLSIAHDGILSGHLGVQRTLNKVTSNFYWPKIHDDVIRYCRSCDICQKTAKKGSQPKAPLGTMPKIDVPFKRVAMDLIGPIVPCSERKHRYILTVVCLATKYPEAVALKNIDAITVAEALVEIYSRIGIPEESLSDRGSQFTADVMKEVCRLLSIKQIFTTPFHPQCNGECERFNSTLKTILKRLCSENPKQWDRYLPAVLFAYRSTKQESTHYSPFELIFGRTIRGPMEILYDFWSDAEIDDQTKTVYQYVLDLKSKLADTCKLAQEELSKAKERHKIIYDRKAKPKKFKIGSKVLLLLPVKHNKLLLQWRGPYDVIGKLSPLNYKIKIGKQEKVYHVNMLREYHERDKITASIIVTDISEQSEQHETNENKEMIKTCPLEQTEYWNDVIINDKLTTEQQQDIRKILEEFEDILTDLPGCTDTVKHEITTTTTDAIKVKPYPLPYAIREIIKAEIMKMLRMGIIQKSNSPYAAPPVIVNKPDGSKRFCIAYVKLNSVTVFDGEPMPNAEDIYIKMRGKKYFSKFDLTKGFWQIQMDENSIGKTAFCVPDGTYEFLRMPFGLKNSVASFNRLMRIVLEGAHNDIECFVDDVIIGSDDWTTHLEAIISFFTHLRQHHLHARPTKCMIGFPQMEYVGHEIDEMTIKPRKEKVEEIQNLPKPTTKKGIRSFLGATGYYSQFISRYSDIAEPLTRLTKKGEPNTLKWEAEQDKAFSELKQKLSCEPVLRIPDINRTMYLQTDASTEALGAVLLQVFDEMFHPIKFISRKLKAAEKNYSISELECLAIIWAIQKFRVYLYGKEFVILTDHKPLTVLNHSGSRNSRIMRWSLFLQDWPFKVKAIRGSDNHLPDYLSRP